MKQRVIKTIPFLWVILGIAWDVWYYITRGKMMLDPDMSAGMVLADVLNSEHSISGLSTNWLYASELRFLHMEWLFRPALLMFPDDWHMARVVASTAALCLMAFAVWLVFFAMGRKEWGIWAAAMTVFPGGSWYFSQTIYGTEYIPEILISFYSFALILLATGDGRKKGRAVCAFIAVLLGVGAGINGVKQLMVFYAPLVLSLLLLLVFRTVNREEGCIMDKRIFKERSFRVFVLSCIVSAAAVTGYLINTNILSRIYSFRQYSDAKINCDSFLDMLRLYLWSFGFNDGKQLMSPSGVASMCGVLFGLAVLFSAIRLLCRYGELGEAEQMLTALSVISIFLCCFIYSYVKGYGDIRYYQPVIPFGYCLVVMEILTERFVFRNSAFVTMTIAMLVLLAASAGPQ